MRCSSSSGSSGRSKRTRWCANWKLRPSLPISEQMRMRAPSGSANQAALRSRWRRVRSSWKRAASTWIRSSRSVLIDSAPSSEWQMSDDLLVLECAEEAGEPGDAAGEGVLAVVEEERGEVELALGEAGEVLAGVAEQDAAGAEGIDEVGDEFLAGGFVAAEEGLGGVIGARGAAGEELPVLLGGHLAGLETGHGVGERLVPGGLGLEGLEVGVAVGVEEAEAREVALGSELLRGWR